MGFGLMYYPIGFVSIYRRSVKLLNWFTTLSLIGLLAEMLLAYINKYINNIFSFWLNFFFEKKRFNLIIFFLRILSYVYGKFLTQLIVSMLILPR